MPAPRFYWIILGLVLAFHRTKGQPVSRTTPPDSVVAAFQREEASFRQTITEYQVSRRSKRKTVVLRYITDKLSTENRVYKEQTRHFKSGAVLQRVKYRRGSVVAKYNTKVTYLNDRIVYATCYDLPTNKRFKVANNRVS